MELLNALDANQVPQFRSHKVVRALKIRQVKYLSASGVVELTFEDDRYAPVQVSTHDKPKPEDGWYYVVYPNGYHSFSPAPQFEEGYTGIGAPIHIAGFGWALKQLQNGARVRRSGWNGKGMFIFLVPGSRFTVNRHPLLGIYPEGTEIDYRSHIDIKTADGSIVPWVPAQTDLLATDWELAE